MPTLPRLLSLLILYNVITHPLFWTWELAVCPAQLYLFLTVIFSKSSFSQYFQCLSVCVLLISDFNYCNSILSSCPAPSVLHNLSHCAQNFFLYAQSWLSHKLRWYPDACRKASNSLKEIKGKSIVYKISMSFKDLASISRLSALPSVLYVTKNLLYRGRAKPFHSFLPSHLFFCKNLNYNILYSVSLCKTSGTLWPRSTPLHPSP